MLLIIILHACLEMMLFFTAININCCFCLNLFHAEKRPNPILETKTIQAVQRIRPAPSICTSAKSALPTNPAIPIQNLVQAELGLAARIQVGYWQHLSWHLNISLTIQLNVLIKIHAQVWEYAGWQSLLKWKVILISMVLLRKPTCIYLSCLCICKHAAFYHVSNVPYSSSTASKREDMIFKIIPP